MKAETSFSLKDQLFNRDKVNYLADLIAANDKQFSKRSFVSRVMKRLPELELKQRIDWIAETLTATLPTDYRAALKLIVKSLPDRLDPEKTDDDFGDFIISPLSRFVSLHGCSRRYLKTSLAALREITQRFTVEGDIRYFLNAFPDETLKFLESCSSDSNYHVRRLASEGSRPTLPWAQKIDIDYRRCLQLLDPLFADRTRYVTRSVANHLNDVTKFDPQTVIDLLSRWQQSGEQQPHEMRFICEHALRTLVKQGHQGALKLLGFPANPKVEVKLNTTTPAVRIGEAFEFSVDLTSLKKQSLIVDYSMAFAAKSPEKPPTHKVFKLKRLELQKGEQITLTKKHPLRLMTTKPLYPGRHKITLQINGKKFGSLDFVLSAK